MSDLREWICNYDSKKARKISNITLIVAFAILILAHLFDIYLISVWLLLILLAGVSGIFDAIGEKKEYFLADENILLVFISNHRVLFWFTSLPVIILFAIIFKTNSNAIFVVITYYLVCIIISLLIELKIIKKEKK